MKYKVIDKTFDTYEEALAYTRTIQGGQGASMIETVNDDAQPNDNGSSDDDIGSFLDNLFGQAQSGSERDRAAGRAFSENEVQEARMNWMMQQNQREYEQDLYDQRYSFRGQINQMQQANLNPALLYGGVGSTASQGGAVSQTADGPSHDTTSSPTDRLNSFISLFSQLFGFGADIAEKINTIRSGKSQRTLNEKQGNLVDAEVASEGARKENIEADTRNKDAQTDFTKNQQILNSLMAVLDRRLKRGQINEQDWKVQSAALDYAFQSESYQDRLDAIALQNNNLRATHALLQAETSETWTRKSMEEQNRLLLSANTELQEYMITQEGLNTEVRQYAQDNGLPYDQPVVVMTHQRLNDALAQAMIDKASAEDPSVKKKAAKHVATLTKAIGDIEASCAKMAQGKMSKAEKTKYITEVVQKAISEVVKAGVAYAFTKNAAAGKFGSSTVVKNEVPTVYGPTGKPASTYTYTTNYSQ